MGVGWAIEGAKEITKEITDEDIKSYLAMALEKMKSKDAIKEISNQYSLPKNRVYDIYLKNWKNQSMLFKTSSIF